MWFIDDIVINGINWYEITLIENDVVIEDIDNNWYKAMLVFIIILIWDDVVIDGIIHVGVL